MTVKCQAIVDVKGLRDLPPRYRKAADDANRLIAERCWTYARANIRVGAGDGPHTRDTVYLRTLSINGRTGYAVGTDSPVGTYLEQGTRPHIIRPVRAKALRFEVNGEVVFARLVHHPGTRPYPWLMPAFERAVNETLPVLLGIVQRAR